MAANNLKANITAIPRGQPYRLSTTISAPELPERAGALPERLQDIAREYIGARHKSGHALLEAARWLSEARMEAKHGEWKVFLDATGTSDDTAERLLNIHAQAMQNPQFADFVRTQWIGQSAAALLSAPSTPPEIIDQVLRAPDPPTVASIKSAIKDAKQPAAPFWQSMSLNHPTAHLWTKTGMNEHHAACGMVTQRVPSGSTDAGHCSSCVRATWPQNQAAAARFPDLTGGWFYAHHRNESAGKLFHIWRSEPSKSAKIRFVSACDMAMQHEEPRRVVDLTDPALRLCAECRQSGPSSLLRATEEGTPADKPNIPELAPVIATDDHAIITQIRAEAAALGMAVVWEDDTVTLYDPADGADSSLPQTYNQALRWMADLREDAAPLGTPAAWQPPAPTSPALAALDATIPPALEQAGYFWFSESPPIIAHNDGNWRGERPTFEAALQLAWDREREKASAPTARADWWNCGNEHRAINTAIGQGDRLGAARAALHLAVAIIGDALIDYGGHMSEAEYEALKLLVRREKMEATG